MSIVSGITIYRIKICVSVQAIFLQLPMFNSHNHYNVHKRHIPYTRARGATFYLYRRSIYYNTVRSNFKMVCLR